MQLRRQVIVLGAVLLATPFSQAQYNRGIAAETRPEQAQVGQVAMANSCSDAATAHFQRGLALMHSFWWEEARKAFHSAAEADSDCAMAYWGVAMSYNDDLHGAPSEEDIKNALQAVEKAHAAKPRTERERAYISAVESLYRGHPRLNRWERDLAYNRAMEKIYLAYPEDQEAATFYSLSLLALARRSEESGYRLQEQAAQMLEPLFADLPNHPGLAHYLIHTYDDSGQWERGLAAARRYAKIAPAVTHAQHMPSHIFAGLGMWDEAIASNLGALAASPSYYHALGYVVYSRLQKGQFRQAERLVEEHKSLTLAVPGQRAERRALEDLETRLLLETRRWKEAANVPTYLDTPLEKAAALYARGLGAAHTGDFQAATRNLEELRAIAQQLDSSSDSGMVVRARRIAIQAKQVEATIRLAQKRGEEAVRLMQEACQMEDDPEVDRFPPDSGTGFPAHEFFGEILLELDRPQEAKREFAMALKRTPRRLHSVYGLAKAAALSGDHETARVQYEALLQLLEHADAGLPEAEEGRKYLANRKAASLVQ